MWVPLCSQPSLLQLKNALDETNKRKAEKVEHEAHDAKRQKLIAQVATTARAAKTALETAALATIADQLVTQPESTTQAWVYVRASRAR